MKTKQDRTRTERISFSRERIVAMGGSIEPTEDGFEIAFPAQDYDPTPIVNEFLAAGFTRDESWRAVDDACEARLWRGLREVVMGR